MVDGINYGVFFVSFGIEFCDFFIFWKIKYGVVFFSVKDYFVFIKME